MSLLNLKKIFKTKNFDESQFILGIDLGNSTSSICYFDAVRNHPEIIDISGGYGKTNMPTVIQYIPQSKEWVFGEYAILNKGVGEDITFSYLIDKLGKKEYVEIDNKLESVVGILSLYLKELINNCKNINPKAEIAGIVVAIPSYMPEEAKEELHRCFALIGYDKKIIDYVSDRECIFSNYYFNRKPEKENIMILDYGSRELRGGIFEVTPDLKTTDIKTLSYLFDNTIGIQQFDEAINHIFVNLYKENTGKKTEELTNSEIEQISAFAYQHKDVIFQRSIFNKAVKLYFNFTYPPFQCSFSKNDSDKFITPFKEKFYRFLKSLMKNSTSGTYLDFGDIASVICVGGGFEMLWAREAVEDIFPDSNIVKFKNAKAAIAEGASIIAASFLDVTAKKKFVIEDNLQVKEDIGLYVLSNEHNKFVPIIERNTFWWQNKKSLKLIINEKIEEKLNIDLFKRDSGGNIDLIGTLDIDGFSSRIKGSIKVELRLSFENQSTIKAGVYDLGFGAFFPPTGMSNEVTINLT